MGILNYSQDPNTWLEVECPRGRVSKTNQVLKNDHLTPKNTV